MYLTKQNPGNERRESSSIALISRLHFLFDFYSVVVALHGKAEETICWFLQMAKRLPKNPAVCVVRVYIRLARSSEARSGKCQGIVASPAAWMFYLFRVPAQLHKVKQQCAPLRSNTRRKYGYYDASLFFRVIEKGRVYNSCCTVRQHIFCVYIQIHEISISNPWWNKYLCNSLSLKDRRWMSVCPGTPGSGWAREFNSCYSQRTRLI